MIIKKFQAKTESEAIEAAKKELGANVVVMNVRNIKRKGIFAFFKPQLVEVTVALEDDTDRAIQEKANVRNITEALGKVNSIVTRAEQSRRSERIDIKVRDDDDSDDTPIRSVSYEKPKGTGSMLEEKLDSLQNLIEEKLQPEGEKNTRTASQMSLISSLTF